MNRNTLYAQLFVDSLIAAGLKHVCLAPGSRNTPLVLAFAKRKDKISITSHLDERSMAFFALGLARAINEPVAIVCTSGSAAANFFPSIVEAHQSRIPMIVLTADRPPELRHSGANQTIDQVKMFGDYALWFVDAPLPEANPSQHLLRYVRTLAYRAFDTANGSRKGVVHINMPFRPPLEPTVVEGDLSELPEGFAEEARAESVPIHTDFSGFSAGIWIEEIDTATRGIIVLGPNASRIFEPLSWNYFLAFADNLGFPIFADAASGERFISDTLIGGYGMFLPTEPEILQNIDFIIRIGDVPTSKSLNAYLDSQHPTHYYHITPDGVWADDSYRVTQVYSAPDWRGLIQYVFYERSEGKRPSTSGLGGLISSTDDSPQRQARREWLAQVKRLEKSAWQFLAPLMAEAEFEGGFVRDLLSLAPSANLLAGNSMPIRHIDLWGRPSESNIMIYASRGASGIDGNISTALGIGAAYKSMSAEETDGDHPLVLLIGDVTFYHDMNGLLAIQRCGVPIVIVLLNNSGGGIFRTLPVKDYEPDFTDYFITPHTLDFSHAAALYGLQHERLTKRADFRAAFPKAIEGWREGQSTLLEIITDSNVDVATRREILKEVQEKLKSV